MHLRSGNTVVDKNEKTRIGLSIGCNSHLYHSGHEASPLQGRGGQEQGRSMMDTPMPWMAAPSAYAEGLFSIEY